MDVKLAAQRTTEAGVAAIDPNHPLLAQPKASLAHLRYMNERIQAGQVFGEKAHRWLGWIQAVVYLSGALSHDALQKINETS